MTTADVAEIDSSDDGAGGGAVFFNVWDTPDRDHQNGLVAAMRAEATAFVDKSGFLGMSVYASDDGHRVIVDGRWRSRPDFESAVSDDASAQASRQTLQRWGSSNADLYRRAFTVYPQTVADKLEPGPVI